jgi:hypothetical protein
MGPPNGPSGPGGSDPFGGGNGGGGNGGGGDPDFDPDPDPNAYGPWGRLQSSWKFRPDTKDYRTLKDMAYFAEWFGDLKNVMRSHGLAHLAYSRFVPHLEDLPVFNAQNAWMYNVLNRNLLAPEAQDIVQEHVYDYDAQMVIAKLVHFSRRSAYGVLRSTKLLQHLQTVRLGNSWNKTTYEFIISFQKYLRQYNEMQRNHQMRINPIMAKTLLENAVAPVEKFRLIQQRETEAVLRGGRTFSYDEYVTLLKHTATLADQAN